MVKFVTIPVPKNVGGYSITHNDHKIYHEDVKTYVERLHLEPLGDDDWVSVESREFAYANDELWEIQWYPDSTVGFCSLYAGRLEDLVKYFENEEET